jgi:xanthine dehydrogenase YagT iron-sulfur-binding subunit
MTSVISIRLKLLQSRRAGLMCRAECRSALRNIFSPSGAARRDIFGAVLGCRVQECSGNDAHRQWLTEILCRAGASGDGERDGEAPQADGAILHGLHSLALELSASKLVVGNWIRESPARCVNFYLVGMASSFHCDKKRASADRHTEWHMAQVGTAEATRQTAALSQKIPVRLTVNGAKVELSIAPWTTLLDALRDRLDLTGTKKGCDHGQCGACTVLVDGRRINSCLTLAVMKDGAEVTTIEGLASNGALHPLQQAFIDHDAFQCGYCTSGQICSAAGLIAEGKAKTADEIRELMSGNICRCGAYPNIVAAIQQAMERS